MGAGRRRGQIWPGLLPVSRCCPSSCWLEAGSGEDHIPPAPLQLGAAGRPSSGRWVVSRRDTCNLRAALGKEKEGGIPSSSPCPLPAEGTVGVAVVAVTGQVVRATTCGWRGPRTEGVWVPECQEPETLGLLHERETNDLFKAPSLGPICRSSKVWSLIHTRGGDRAQDQV